MSAPQQGATRARAVLALFAKAPVPGQVKTRLHPPLTLEQAADLYAAMLQDIAAQHAAGEPGHAAVEPGHAAVEPGHAAVEPGVGERGEGSARGGASAGVALALWHAPATADAWFRGHIPSTYRLYAQRGENLPRRMRHLFHTHADEGYARIVLRGTDSPSLPSARVAEAFAALESADLVLCPDRDGGYNLIGLRRPEDSLFELEMSTANVLDATLARAREKGLRVHILEPHHDVDTFADLLTLAGELDAVRTPRTLRWWRAHRTLLRADWLHVKPRAAP
jgi:hypothetical protein